MTDLYFGQLDEDPFDNALDQTDSWLKFVDLLLALCFDQIDLEPTEDIGRVGSPLSEYEPMELTAPIEIGRYVSTKAVYSVFEKLIKKGLDSDGMPLFPLSGVMLGLGEAEILALVLGLAVTRKRKYERLFGILQETDNEPVFPTVGLCVDLARFFLDKDTADISALFVPDSFFNRYFIIHESQEEQISLRSVLYLNPLLLDFISGHRGSMGHLSICALINEAKGESFYDDLHDGETKELTRVIENSLAVGNDDPKHRIMIELTGEKGIGRETIAALAAKQFGTALLSVDVNCLLFIEEKRQDSHIRDIVLKCALEGYLPYLKNYEHSPEGEVASLVAKLQRDLIFIIMGGEKPMPDSFSASVQGAVYRITVSDATPIQQRHLWEIKSRELGLEFSEEISLDEVVSKYTMNPGRITEVLENTRMGLISPDEKVSRSQLETQIRRSCSVQFGDNATRLSSPFSWDDLMIDDTGEKLLRMAADRVRYRTTVNDHYGFAKKLPYGRGVAIVFYGPPGTGKTMAAQVLANELGLDIYRIDLSQVSSKYIGETEKNLGAVFNAAKNSNAILFFDEADSLFAKRTDVSSSNDKHANAQTSYLLQKIEEYSGVSVLATNNLQNFDAAFKRRMTYLIPIEAPDEATRRRLWEAVFPEDTPVDSNVDFSFLAREVKLSGSSIKSAAVAAAYMAASRHRKVGYDELIEAIDLECIKTGELGVGARLSQAVLMNI